MYAFHGLNWSLWGPLLASMQGEKKAALPVAEILSPVARQAPTEGGLCFRTRTLKTVETSRKSWQRTFSFSAPSFGGNPKYPPFCGFPSLFYKAPPRQTTWLKRVGAGGEFFNNAKGKNMMLLDIQIRARLASQDASWPDNGRVRAMAAQRKLLRGLHYSFRGFFELIFITVTVSFCF